MSLFPGIESNASARLAPGDVLPERARLGHALDGVIATSMPRCVPRTGADWSSTRLHRVGLAVVVLTHVLILSGIALTRPETKEETERTLSATLILAESTAAVITPTPSEPVPPVEVKPAQVPKPPEPEVTQAEPARPVEPPSLAALPPRPIPAPQVPVTQPVPLPVPAPIQPLELRTEPRPEPVVVKAQPVPMPAPSVPTPMVRPDAEQAPAARATPAALPGKPDDVKRYIATLMRQLNRHKTYPPALKKAKTEGRVVLRFTLDKSGRLMASAVQQSSGHAELDRAAMEMLARASPLPAIPDFMARDELALAIPVEYSLITDR